MIATVVTFFKVEETRGAHCQKINEETCDRVNFLTTDQNIENIGQLRSGALWTS